MSNEIAIHQEPSDSLPALKSALDIFGAMVKSNVLPKGIQSASDAAIVAIYGARFGWGPIQSLFGCYIIEGAPALKTDSMVGVILSSKSVCQYFDCIETTDKKAVYVTKRVGSERETRLEYTIDQAKRAGLPASTVAYQAIARWLRRQRMK